MRKKSPPDCGGVRKNCGIARERTEVRDEFCGSISQGVGADELSAQ